MKHNSVINGITLICSVLLLMDDSTDPSKYVSEDSILRFLTDLGAESVGTADMLDGWKLPDGFDMTA